MGRIVAFPPPDSDSAYYRFQTAGLYDIDSDRTIYTTGPLSGVRTCLAISPDGKYVVVGGGFNSDQFAVIDRETGARMSVSALMNFPRNAQFSPNGEWLAIGSGNAPYFGLWRLVGSTWQYQTTTGTSLSSTNYGLSFSEDSTKLGTIADGKACIVDLATLVAVAVETGLSTIAYGCSFSPDSKKLRYLNGNVLRTYDLTTSALSSISFAGAGNTQSYALSRDESILLVGRSAPPWLLAFGFDGVSTLTSIPVTSPIASIPRGLGISHDAKFAAVAYPQAQTADRTNFLLNLETFGFETARNIPQSCTNLNNPINITFTRPNARKITGFVTDKDGAPAARNIIAYVRGSKVVAGRTVSDALTGEYELLVYDGDVEYDLQFEIAPGEALNDIFFARATSVEV